MQFIPNTVESKKCIRDFSQWKGTYNRYKLLKASYDIGKVEND